MTIAPYGGEQLPTNYEALITAAIQGYAATLKIGQGILIDTWKGLVYSACSGIDTVTIRQKKGSGDWQTDDIAMAYNERPVNPVDVTVILA